LRQLIVAGCAFPGKRERNETIDSVAKCRVHALAAATCKLPVWVGGQSGFLN
jgi:hypothetical protein